jgi:hypothetical protein
MRHQGIASSCAAVLADEACAKTTQVADDRRVALGEMSSQGESHDVAAHNEVGELTFKLFGSRVETDGFLPQGICRGP